MNSGCTRPPALKTRWILGATLELFPVESFPKRLDPPRLFLIQPSRRGLEQVDRETVNVSELCQWVVGSEGFRMVCPVQCSDVHREEGSGQCLSDKLGTEADSEIHTKVAVILEECGH